MEVNRILHLKRLQIKQASKHHFIAVLRNNYLSQNVKEAAAVLGGNNPNHAASEVSPNIVQWGLRQENYLWDCTLDYLYFGSIPVPF